MKIKVLGTERRRRWSLLDKLQIVEETLQPGVAVTEVARRHGLAPSVVFTWRRLAREGRPSGNCTNLVVRLAVSGKLTASGAA